MNVTSACRDINELSATAQKACRIFLEECRKEGLQVCITETYRSQERQNYLYEQGRSRPGKVVTWTKSSRHTGRMAWDICKNVRGQEYSDLKFFEKCGVVAKRLGIIWGGTWSTPDRPHFEVTKNWKYDGKEEKEMVEKDKIKIFGKEVTMKLIRKDGRVYPDIREFCAAAGLKISNDGRMPVVEK